MDMRFLVFIHPIEVQIWILTLSWLYIIHMQFGQYPIRYFGFYLYVENMGNINTSRLRQNGRPFADDHFKCIFF